MAIKYYLPSRFFNGEKFVENKAIVVENGKIKNFIPKNELPEAIDLIELKNQWIVPAYKDLQINGAGGIMFSAQPSVEALQEIYDYSISGGATGFLATIPTNSFELIATAIEAAREYQKQGLKGLLGLHLEGPYINPVKKGAHNEKHIKKPTLEEVKELVNMGGGMIKMITLAPECCSDEVIEYLLKKDIILSAGHSNATYEEAKHGFSLGINLCTHLYNAMSNFSHREPGLVGAIFDSEVYSGFIPDGVHTTPAALRIAHKIMGDRLFFVSDAITETKTDSYQYIRKKDRFVTEKGTLAGSCLTMETAVQKAVSMGIPLENALRKASLIPAQVLNEDHRVGKIEIGYEVDWAVLDPKLTIIQTIKS